MTTYALSSDEFQQARVEMRKIKAQMGQHLDPSREVQPIFRDDGTLIFMLDPSEFLWLAVDGSAMRDRVNGGLHKIDAFRGGQVVGVMDAEKR